MDLLSQTARKQKRSLTCSTEAQGESAKDCVGTGRSHSAGSSPTAVCFCDSTLALSLAAPLRLGRRNLDSVNIRYLLFLFNRQTPQTSFQDLSSRIAVKQVTRMRTRKSRRELGIGAKLCL